LEKKARGYQAYFTRCRSMAPIADVEASVTSASGACLALFEGLQEFQRPGDGVGALDLGRRERHAVVSGGRRMGQKSSIEVQHAQKSKELTGGLAMVAVLEMGHSFFQRLGNLGGHLVTEEGDLGCVHFTGLMRILYL
jgi:hypothetical protein